MGDAFFQRKLSRQPDEGDEVKSVARDVAIDAQVFGTTDFTSSNRPISQAELRTIETAGFTMPVSPLFRIALPRQQTQRMILLVAIVGRVFFACLLSRYRHRIQSPVLEIQT